MTEYRADQVGSLLRPRELLNAREAFQAGSIAANELREHEDRAIRDALRMQEEVGIDVFTDGEMRRDGWMSDVADAVEGFVDQHRMMHWHKPDGGTEDEPSRSRIVGAKLRQVRRLTAHEMSFLREHTSRPIKMTMPSPVTLANSGYEPGVTDQAYPTRAELLADLVEIIRSELKALVNDGVSYVQLDEGFLAYLGEEWRERLQAMGQDPDRSLAADIAAENACYDAIPRDRLTLGIHICRGNSRSRWVGTGGYDRLAEQLFNTLHVDRFLLEYDSERAGGFEPLRFLPEGKTAVLGLVSTKHGELEDMDELLRRIDEAAKHAPPDQLALSPQCGFASVAEGNLLSRDDERRKLELVVETTRRAWG